MMPRPGQRGACQGPGRQRLRVARADDDQADARELVKRRVIERGGRDSGRGVSGGCTKRNGREDGRTNCAMSADWPHDGCKCNWKAAVLFANPRRGL